MFFGLSFEFFIIIALAVVLIFAIISLLTGSKGTTSEGYFFLEDDFPGASPRHPRQPHTNDRAFTTETEESAVGTRRGHGPVESLGEAECRRVLQSIYGVEFPKVRPAFLRNEALASNRPLELDCYNEDLKLACEYDGRAHAEYTRYFHRNEEAFENQKYRDWMKSRLCAENGIHLIRVPHTVKHKDIEAYIRERLPSDR